MCTRWACVCITLVCVYMILVLTVTYLYDNAIGIINYVSRHSYVKSSVSNKLKRKMIHVPTSHFVEKEQRKED